MSYRADVYRLMIASPSDVPRERQLARDVIYEWNSVHSEDRSIVLMPVGWETHSSPEMGDRPQEIINRQVLKNCDLLVAVFWTRLGSPTGKSPSGTVEEIEEHLSAGKPAMIYFSSAPVHPDSIDLEQYQALLEFKKSCKERGLVEEYESLTEFREKFSRHLAHRVILSFSKTNSATNLDSDFGKTDTSVPALSDAAQEILVEAAKDPHGRIVRLDTNGGLFVQTNGRQLVVERTPREEARWQAALDQLINYSLIQDLGYKQEVFQVTDSGYRVADLLSQE